MSADQETIGGKYPVGTTIKFKFKSEDYVLEGDVMNGDTVLEAEADGIYTVTIGNADITITVIITLSGGNYTAKDGDVLTGSTSGTVTIEDGASITLSDVTINGGIVCEGTATITLVGENNVTGLDEKAGIQVGGEETTLTIKGNGSLTATGGDYGAGIGTGYVNSGRVTFGNIIIKGGSITANGGEESAGIGTGEIGSWGNVTFGNITIKGGSITANGGHHHGAGIGTGGGYGGNVKLGNITIEGGSIKAEGGLNAAGIGTGRFNGNATLGTLTIYDDIDLVDATGEPGISEDVVYMHGETDVTGTANDYFIIMHDDFSDVIKSKKHAITLVNDGQHGTVTVVAKEMSGESVTITVTPDNGYMLDTIEVKDANGNEVELDEDEMSFTMPDSDVTIKVTWKLAGVKGDVNGDGKVDISDVVALVNAILNDSPYNDAYDVNGDTSVGINDVVAMVYIILGR